MRRISFVSRMLHDQAKIALLPVLLACILLTGCAPSYRIENQAHAICMGIDYEAGEMTVIVQVPSFGATAGKDGGEADSTYQIYSAQAQSFEKAYNILQATLPQQLNLTHLKSVVFSEKFARSDMFLSTIDTFMNVFLVTGSASVIVTEKSARLLIENQKPHIGIRLSITVPSMLSYHAENGYIPSTTLSSLYQGLKGHFSTAICALSDTAYEDEVKSENNTYTAGDMRREGVNKNEYMGAALFDRERMIGKINGREMQLMYFLSDPSTRIADFTDPAPIRLSSRRRSDVYVDTTGDRVKIKVTLYLDVSTLHESEDVSALRKSFENDFLNLIEKCQSMKVEPFGFSYAAGRNFLSNKDWNAYDWLTRFSASEVTVDVQMNAEK